MSELIDPTDESGKRRVQRIPIDYYRKRGRLYWWRWWMAGGALIFAGIYAAFALLTPRKAVHFSTGPISAAHASFEQDCRSCHRDWTPIAGDAWRWDPHEAVERTASSCRNCHSVPSHQFASLNARGRSVDSQCAHCHREHRGRDRSLIAHDDHTCTQCHSDLDLVRKRDAPLDTAAEVQQFTLASHGDFRSLQPTSDPPRGRIKFNHAMHMQPGQVDPGYRGGTRVGMLRSGRRDEYRRPGQDDNALVQLACIDCHSFSDSPADHTLGDSGDGRYSQPIRYEDHCAACHQLTTVGQEEDQPPLPHGIAPAGMKKLVRDRLAGLQVDALRRGREDSPSSKAVWIPGKEKPSAAQATDENLDMIDARAEGLTSRLRDQCRLCHLDEDIDSPPGEKMIPARWLRSGKFDHGAHANMNCLICHPQADPTNETLSPAESVELSSWLAQLESPPQAADASRDDRETVMIVGVESCVPCHRDGPSEASSRFDKLAGLQGDVSSLAPDDCSTCHRYHWSRPHLGLMKTEPTALAAGLGATVNTPLRPEASAYGSHQSRFSSARPQLVTPELHARSEARDR